MNGLVIHRQDDVASLQAGLGGGLVRRDIGDDRTFDLLRNAELLADVRREVGKPDADLWPALQLCLSSPLAFASCWPSSFPPMATFSSTLLSPRQTVIVCLSPGERSATRRDRSFGEVTLPLPTFVTTSPALKPAIAAGDPAVTSATSAPCGLARPRASATS
jgi:hypothetical protein